MLLGVDEARRMSGAGAASRVRATAGVTTVWGRALRAELVKVVTLLFVINYAHFMNIFEKKSF